jgi:hypothetical protein
VVDVPPARAAAGGDRRAEPVLQGAALSRRIDAGVRNRAGEIASRTFTKIVPFAEKFILYE